MKQFWASFGGQLVASLMPLIILGIVALLIWRKIFGAQTASQVVGNVVDSAASIPAGLSSLIGSTVRGESETGYITTAQQRELAAQNLARMQGRQGS